jgi:heme O synthase-like polyprenyltransferase
MNWGSCLKNGTVPTLDCIPTLFGIVVNDLLAFVGTAAVLVMIYSGIQMMIARGDAKNLDNAHKTFFYSIIGLLIVLFSFLAVNLIAYVTGVHCITTFGFTSCTK